MLLLSEPNVHETQDPPQLDSGGDSKHPRGDSTPPRFLQGTLEANPGAKAITQNILIRNTLRTDRSDQTSGIIRS